jgi:solute carrier family 25 phosphate transporter 23/24/25/41
MAMVVPKEGLVVMDKESVSSASSDSHLRLQPHFPDFTIPVKDFFKSREAREFLSGALAGAMTKAVLAPLETIRSV